MIVRVVMSRETRTPAISWEGKRNGEVHRVVDRGGGGESGQMSEIEMEQMFDGRCENETGRSEENVSDR
jgi:hypothetical protein